MTCVSIELGERLLFKEEECEMMSQLCRVLRPAILRAHHMERRSEAAGGWMLVSEFPLSSPSKPREHEFDPGTRPSLLVPIDASKMSD